VPAGIASTSGGAPDGAAGRSGPVALRLGSYTLTLPDRYHLSDARTAPCATGAGAGQETAAVASGVCVIMFFLPPASPGRAGPNLPRDAEQVTVGRYRAWVNPPASDGTALVIEADGRDLVIRASGLSRPALVSLVSSGLSAA
jgi:hypothetical protein